MTDIEREMARLDRLDRWFEAYMRCALWLLVLLFLVPLLLLVGGLAA